MMTTSPLVIRLDTPPSMPELRVQLLLGAGI